MGRSRVAFAVLALLPLAVAGVPAAHGSEACAPIEGMEPVLVPGTMTLFGEIHGTREAPGLVSEVLCHAAAAGRSVLLGVELLPEEASRIEAYLASDGGPADRRALVAAGRWSSAYQDGRSSQAMADLLDRVRALRAVAARVDIALFNRHPPSRNAADRDRAMATALAAAVRGSKADLVVVLTGNLHSRLRRSAAFEPMGYHLSAAGLERSILAFDLAHQGGEAWMCNGGSPGDCGIRRIAGRSDRDTLAIERFETLSDRGFHGRYHVGRVTASPPAARPASAESDRP